MPITIPNKLPVKQILEEENIFVMDDNRALSQDIRPLNILILNLMPEKEKTEAQLLRLLSNTPLQVKITFLRMETHESKNTPHTHLEQFYSTFPEVSTKRFDGLIITGAPVEKLDFEEVHYWNELINIMDWSREHVTSSLHICWGAQAALYHHFGISKQLLNKKCTGIYKHKVLKPFESLVRGFDDVFYAPHSRYTDIEAEEIRNHEELIVLAESEEAGLFLVASKDKRLIMVTGHPEYDLATLSQEYKRDLSKGSGAPIPQNYFPEDDPLQLPFHTWKSHASLLFSNWLNYYVYQTTPYQWK